MYQVAWAVCHTCDSYDTALARDETIGRKCLCEGPLSERYMGRNVLLAQQFGKRTHNRGQPHLLLKDLTLTTQITCPTCSTGTTAQATTLSCQVSWLTIQPNLRFWRKINSVDKWTACESHTASHMSHMFDWDDSSSNNTILSSILANNPAESTNFGGRQT
jgi:hypothetical protein